MAEQIIGISKLQARLKAISGPEATRAFVGRIGLRTVAAMKRRIPRKTSTTGRSLRIGRIANDRAEIFGNKVALYLDRGTRPHVIVPKRKKALRFAATAAGRRLSGNPRVAAQRGELGGVVFAKRVNHPGTRAQPFIVASVQEALRKSGLKDAVVERWNGAA